MRQLIKKFQPLVWIIAILFSVVLIAGCSGDSTKTEEPNMETTAPAPMDSAKVDMVAPAAKDSLPTIDTSASSRPEGIKTKAKTMEK